MAILLAQSPLVVYVHIAIFYVIDYESLNVPDTLTSGFVSKYKSILGFLQNTNSHVLRLAKFELLNVLYANVANGEYLDHI